MQFIIQLEREVDIHIRRIPTLQLATLKSVINTCQRYLLLQRVKRLLKRAKGTAICNTKGHSCIQSSSSQVLCTISELDSEPRRHYCNFQYLTWVTLCRWHFWQILAEDRLAKLEQRYHTTVWLLFFIAANVINSSLQTRNISVTPTYRILSLPLEKHLCHSHWPLCTTITSQNTDSQQQALQSWSKMLEQ